MTIYKVYGRYYGGRKFKTKADCLSAMSAVSMMMAPNRGVRVAICIVK